MVGDRGEERSPSSARPAHIRYALPMHLQQKRRVYSLLVAATLVVALIVLLVLRFHAPPEVARLLPESDAILYLDLKPVRTALHFDQQPVQPSPEYARFVADTGFQWDRDLDRLAISVHRTADPNGPNGPVAYTGVLQGHFDTERLRRYLLAHSSGRETYAGHDIYTVPASEGRVLRISTLGYDLLAASNTPTTEQIHSVIDRYSAGASPFSGSSLLALRYRQVPYFSLAWGIGHVGLPFSDRGNIQVFGITLPLPEDTDFIASLAFRGTLHLRVEELAPTESDAAQTATNMATVLNLLRGFLPSGGTQNERAFRQALQTLQVQQQKSTVVLMGELSPTLLRPAAPR